MDEGAITDKSSLPIQEFRFGGTSGVPMAMAFHRIGKLRCWGTSKSALTDTTQPFQLLASVILSPVKVNLSKVKYSIVSLNFLII